MSAVDNAAAGFRTTFGGDPAGVAFAPGRVNLIGDHVDYNEGLVLPMPLACGTAVAWRLREDRNVVVKAADLGGESHAFNLGEDAPVASGWRSLVHGMVAMTAREVPLERGLEMLVQGDLPRGSGLSSSASLCVAIGRAVAEAAQRPMEPVPMARLAQAVEHEFAGVACGIMDQMASAAGRQGCAMLLDCRSLEARHVPIPKDWSVLVLQSGVTRELVDGAYNERRAQCESAARKLGVASLREVPVGTIEALAKAGLTEIEAMRARHVVSEIERTRQAMAALEAEDIARVGDLMRASHASLRDDFEVSHPEVDRQVAWLNALIGSEGGARMTGGGFGGAMVAICPASQSTEIHAAIAGAGGVSPRDEHILRAFN